VDTLRCGRLHAVSTKMDQLIHPVGVNGEDHSEHSLPRDRLDGGGVSSPIAEPARHLPGVTATAARGASATFVTIAAELAANRGVYRRPRASLGGDRDARFPLPWYQDITMRRLLVLVTFLAFSGACTDDAAPPATRIETSWSFMRGTQRLSCDEAMYDAIRITAVNNATGATFTSDVLPCADGMYFLPVEGGEYQATLEALVGTEGGFDHDEQVVVVPDHATSVVDFVVEVSAPTGRVRATWVGSCATTPSVRFDIAGHGSTSGSCSAHEVTTAPIPIGVGTARLNFISGGIEQFWADYDYALTTRGQILSLPAVQI